MTIVLTGHSGLIGSALLDLIKKELHHIQAFVVTRRNVVEGNHVDLFGEERIQFINIDDLNAIEGLEIDFVINLSGYSSSSDDFEAMEKLVDANIFFPQKILYTLCGKNKVKYYLNFASFSEYSQDGTLLPNYLYSASKTAFLSFLKYYSSNYNFKILNLVLFSVYGGSGRTKRFYDYLLDSVASDKPIELGDPNVSLDWVHVDDVANWLILLVCGRIDLSKISAAHTDVFLGTGVSTSLLEFSDILQKYMGEKFNIIWNSELGRNHSIKYVRAPIEKNSGFMKWAPRKLKDIYGK